MTGQPPAKPWTITCTDGDKPKAYAMKMPTGMFVCVKCGRTVPKAGDAHHAVERS